MKSIAKKNCMNCQMNKKKVSLKNICLSCLLKKKTSYMKKSV